MRSQKVSPQQVSLQAENIGGIEHTDVTFDSGVTVLTGRNATNRTSLLRAIMGGLGSSHVSLKGDADSGRVTLQVGDEEYTRTLERQGETVQFGGDPYRTDPEVADLFAFLLESNEARRSVVLDENLRDIIMRPVDADAIQGEIRQLQSERDDVDERIEKREALKEKLPELEEKRSRLDDESAQKRAELEQKREELEALSADADEARSEQSELESKMDALEQKRSELDTVEFRLESERKSLSSLESEREDIETEYEELRTEETGDLNHITDEISRLRETKQRLGTELSKLQSVIQFNEEMLEGTSTDIAAALRGADDSETVTDKLLDDSSAVVCWTCGTEVDETRIEETLDRLRDLRQSKYSEQSDVESELADRKEQQSHIEAVEQKRETVESRLADVRAEIEQRERKIEDLEAEQAALTADIEDLEDEVETLEAKDRSEVLAAHREVNELELELDRLEDDRERVEAEIDEIEADVEDVETLRERREQITDEIAELRTRVDRIEQQAVEEFNEQMDTVLDILDYDNIDRIWVERVEQEVRQGRRKTTTTAFQLHIVRSTEDGVTYEDDFEHLSESEREVTSVVFALAGYLAHEVYEAVPFILLDSLEAIDAERIATLVDYLREYAEYLVVALLPDDAAALDDDYQRITDI